MKKNDVYKSIEEMTKTKCKDNDLFMVINLPNMLQLKSALCVSGYTDDEVIRKLFACYCKLLYSKSKTVYVETGISPERHREAMLRAIRAENEVEALKYKIARMEQSDRPPRYNIEKGEKIAYKSTVTKEEIIKLMNMGLSQTVIADRLQVSRSTISRRLRE